MIYPAKLPRRFSSSASPVCFLNWPLVAGLGWCDIAWLPGFTDQPVSWGIWFLYVGLILGVATTAYYCVRALEELKRVRGE